MTGFNPTHVPSAEAIARETQVLELRRAGVTFDAIADRVGYADRGAAHKAYRRALARTLQQPAAEVRQLEADRLDRLQVAVWPRALRGDLPAVDRVLRISERRARLLGLDHADGVAEREVRVLEQQGLLLAGVIQRVLGRIELTDQQRDIVPAIVVEELRAAAGSDNVDFEHTGPIGGPGPPDGSDPVV